MITNRMNRINGTNRTNSSNRRIGSMTDMVYAIAVAAVAVAADVYRIVYQCLLVLKKWGVFLSAQHLLYCPYMYFLIEATKTVRRCLNYIYIYMSISNNPYTAYNGMLSSQRNMFVSSSLAVILIGFSQKYKKESFRVAASVVASGIILLSIYIGFKSIYDFEYYLDNIKVPSYIPIDSWRTWKYVVYIYSFVLISIFSRFLYKSIISID